MNPQAQGVGLLVANLAVAVLQLGGSRHRGGRLWCGEYVKSRQRQGASEASHPTTTHGVAGDRRMVA